MGHLFKARSVGQQALEHVPQALPELRIWKDDRGSMLGEIFRVLLLMNRGVRERHQHGGRANSRQLPKSGGPAAAED